MKWLIETERTLDRGDRFSRRVGTGDENGGVAAGKMQEQKYEDGNAEEDRNHEKDSLDDVTAYGAAS